MLYSGKLAFVSGKDCDVTSLKTTAHTWVTIFNPDYDRLLTVSAFAFIYLFIFYFFFYFFFQKNN